MNSIEDFELFSFSLQLSELERDIIIYNVFQGYRINEIAQIKGLTDKTIRKYKKLAFEKINVKKSPFLYIIMSHINRNLTTNISWIIIPYRWLLIKLSKSLVNKGFFTNNSFQFVMTYYFVLTLPESIIRAKSRARIIRILV